MTRTSCWFGVALGTVIGMALLVFSLLSNMSAPQQGAAAAAGCGFAVIPYCFARAFDEINKG